MKYGVTLIALLFLDGCAQNYGLSSKDLAQLTEEARRAIPAKPQKVWAYRDAVVYVAEREAHTDPGYTHYMGGPEAWKTSRRLPTIKMSSSSRTRSIDSLVFIKTEKIRACVPGTEKCFHSKKTIVTVLRHSPLLALDPEICGGRAGSTCGSSGYMLEITHDLLNQLVLMAQDLATRKQIPGASTSMVTFSECSKLDISGRVTWQEHEYMRRNIRRALEKEGYLAYHDLNEWYLALWDRFMAIDGCFDGQPEIKKQIEKRGDEIFAKITARRQDE